jgi:hypothetical protein
VWDFTSATKEHLAASKLDLPFPIILSKTAKKLRYFPVSISGVHPIDISHASAIVQADHQVGCQLVKMLFAVPGCEFFIANAGSRTSL